DLHVLPTAIVPVTATASDNLAIAKGELRIEVARSVTNGDEDSGLEPGSAAPRPAIMPLYSLESPPPLATLPATGVRLDEREFHTELRLADLNLKPGDVASRTVIARDFRPGEGGGATQRR